MSKREIRVEIQKALPHQVGPLDHPARFKVWRWGRRAGKTRAAFLASCLGHGARPNGKGFLQGGDILWIARDYTQAETIWYKELKPRFAGKPVVFEVNEQKKKIVFKQGGQIRVTSAENIDSDRGGAWDGVVIDEGAHVDLQYIYLDVIRPGLADTKGWLIVMSTTKAGSYFNQLCEECLAGNRPGWEHTYRTAYDNPKIDDAEVDAMVEAYDDSAKLDQEIFAKLTVPGGLAFPEWDARAHVKDMTPPKDWDAVACLDWGYVRPGYFGYARLGRDREVYFEWEYPFQETEPYIVGRHAARKMMNHAGPLPLYIVADSQIFSQHEGAVTVADQITKGMMSLLGDRTPALLPCEKGPDSRLQGKVTMHQYLSFEKDDEEARPEAWEAPRLRFHPECREAIRSLSKIPRSPKNPEDVDTDAFDHPYDAIRYLLQRVLPVEWRDDDETWAKERVPQGRHPGFRNGARRKRWIDRSLQASDPYSSRHEEHASYVPFPDHR